MYRRTFILGIVLLPLYAGSQFKTSDSELASTHSIITGVPARCIGFGSLGIRISALAVCDYNPSLFYVGSANGGVLKTTDGGENFSFVFDRYGSSNIGAITMSQQNPDLVWVGTGEGWQRHSVGGGDGIYKTTDGGKTWHHMGLKNCYSFSKIVIHPKNDDIVFAAALGSPWGYGPDRGIYKTMDGGKTWRKVLYHDEKSAGTEVIINPIDPNNMMAALWDHVHRPYGWFGGGPGSAIYRSIDGGEHWTKITEGLPKTTMGRIALDYFPKDPNKVVAAIEVALPHTGYYRSSDGGKTWGELPALQAGETESERGGTHQMHRPYYTHFIKFHPTDSNCFYYSNPSHHTKDGGKTFVGGTYDTHGFWINPNNPKEYISIADGGVGTSKGRIKTLPVLDQLYGVGYDMRKIYRIMGNIQDYGRTVLGRTQSLYRDRLQLQDMMDLPGGHEGGTAMADPNDWATVYCTLYGFGLDRIDLKTGNKKELLVALKKARIATGAGYANRHSYDRYAKLDTPYRANWNTPLLISPWNSHTIYYGTNYLFKSTNRGDTWEVISPDLTHNKTEWQVPDGTIMEDEENPASRAYQTIKTISESPIERNLLWVGTDDGYVQISRDGGKTWNNVTRNIPGLPEYSWVSCIEASKFVVERAYATFANFRNFDLNTYIYVTEDFGKTWKKINGNMPPKEPCNVIREGRKNPDLLYVGTESGLWISLDKGITWSNYKDFEPVQINPEIFDDPFNFMSLAVKVKDPVQNYFPTVRVADLQIHPRELDLIIGSHGRGVWILSARALEEMTPENRNKDVHFASSGNVYLFSIAIKTFSTERIRGGSLNTQPGTVLSYYLKKPATGLVTIKIVDTKGHPILTTDRFKKPVLLKGSGKAGLNAVYWNAKQSSIVPGKYKAILTVDGKEYVQTILVEDASDEVVPGVCQ